MIYLIHNNQNLNNFELIKTFEKGSSIDVEEMREGLREYEEKTLRSIAIVLLKYHRETLKLPPFNGLNDYISTLKDKENLIFVGYVIDSRTNEKIAAFYNNSFDSEINETIYGFLVDTNGGMLNKSSDKFNQYYLIGSDGIINIKNRDILVKYNTPLTEDTYEMLKDNVNKYIKDN